MNVFGYFYLAMLLYIISVILTYLIIDIRRNIVQRRDYLEPSSWEKIFGRWALFFILLAVALTASFRPFATFIINRMAHEEAKSMLFSMYAVNPIENHLINAIYAIGMVYVLSFIYYRLKCEGFLRGRRDA